VTAPLKRFRWAFALGGLAALAIMGQLALNQAAVTIASGLGEARTLVTLGKDFWPIWRDDHQFTSGQGDPFWYGRGISNAWPPPHEVAFAPLSYLPWSAAQLVSVALCAALMVFTMLLWSKREGLYRLRSGLWPMLLSAPVFAVVWIDQLQAVAGLAALSLALWAQRTNRSWLVGVAAAFGVIRVANAIPVLVILLLSFWGKPKQLGIALGSAMLAMAPLVAISFLWDPHWVTDYIDGISAYPFNGTAKVASQSLGYPGLRTAGADQQRGGDLVDPAGHRRAARPRAVRDGDGDHGAGRAAGRSLLCDLRLAGADPARAPSRLLDGAMDRGGCALGRDPGAVATPARARSWADAQLHQLPRFRITVARVPAASNATGSERVRAGLTHDQAGIGGIILGGPARKGAQGRSHLGIVRDQQDACRFVLLIHRQSSSPPQAS